VIRLGGGDYVIRLGTTSHVFVKKDNVENAIARQSIVEVTIEN